MKKSKTQKITEGAMMVALIGVCLFFNRQTAGIFEVDFYWLLSLPILVYTVRTDLKYGVIVFTCSMLLSLMISTPQTMFYMFSAGLIGVLYGYGVQKHWNNRKLLGMTILLTFLSLLISMYIMAGFFGFDVAATRNELLGMIEGMLGFLEELHLTLVLPVSLHLFVYCLDILMFMIIAVLQSLCTHLVAVLVLHKLKIKTAEVKPLKDFMLPRFLGFLTLLLWALVSWADLTSFSENIQFAIVLLFMCNFILSLTYGMIIVRELRRRFKWCWILYIPLFWNLVTMLGACDSLLQGKIRKVCYGQTGKF